MTDSPKDPGMAGEPPKSRVLSSAGRRRLLQAGISAAPVIMTVASRPVLATTNCRTPSGFVSGNVSNSTGVTCLGLNASHLDVREPLAEWILPG